jgi:hypothetical protein
MLPAGALVGKQVPASYKRTSTNYAYVHTKVGIFTLLLLYYVCSANLSA